MEVEKRIDTLEGLLGQFIAHTESALLRLENEMRDFKNEMRDFKNEMREDRKKAFRQWGEIANKIGTFAEDIVAPSIGEIAERYFGFHELEDFMVRRFKRNIKDRSRRREFDIIAVCNDKVILVEVKSTPKVEHINDFITLLNEFYDYFPEYINKEIIPIFASLYLPDEVLEGLTKSGIYAMATKEDMMDLINFDKIYLKR